MSDRRFVQSFKINNEDIVQSFKIMVRCAADDGHRLALINKGLALARAAGSFNALKTKWNLL